MTKFYLIAGFTAALLYSAATLASPEVDSSAKACYSPSEVVDQLQAAPEWAARALSESDSRKVLEAFNAVGTPTNVTAQFVVIGMQRPLSKTSGPNPAVMILFEPCAGRTFIMPEETLLQVLAKANLQ